MAAEAGQIIKSVVHQRISKSFHRRRQNSITKHKTNFKEPLVFGIEHQKEYCHHICVVAEVNHVEVPSQNDVVTQPAENQSWHQQRVVSENVVIWVSA